MRKSANLRFHSNFGYLRPQTHNVINKTPISSYHSQFTPSSYRIFNINPLNLILSIAPNALRVYPLYPDHPDHFTFTQKVTFDTNRMFQRVKRHIHFSSMNQLSTKRNRRFQFRTTRRPILTNV